MRTSVPQTYNRAATALVRARCYLEQACDEVRLAFEILAAPEGDGGVEDPSERTHVLNSLLDFLARLEATQHAAGEAWSTS